MRAVRARSLSTAVSDAWRPWLAVHAIVAVSLLVALAVEGGNLPQAGYVPDGRGLFAWDAAWYRLISRDGYDGAGPEAIRFFPLLPVTGRLLAALGVGVDLGLCLVVSLCSLAYLTAISVLAGTLLPGAHTARRVAWVAALVPGASVLALPYTEALAGLATCVFFLALQTQVPTRVGVLAGVLAGLARPTGLVLAGPAALRAVRAGSRRRAALLAGAPVVGTVLFLVWSGLDSGDPLAPYATQGGEDLRGGLLVNPLPGVLSNGSGGLGAPVTLTLMVLGLGLLVEVFRRLPREYGAWSTVMLLLAVGSTDALSLPRYLAGTVPMLLVVPGLLRSDRAWRVFLVLAPLLSLALTTSWLAVGIVP